MEVISEDMEAINENTDAVDDGMEVVNDADLRERFQLFFSVNPDLTPDDLAKILQSSGWNERVALRKVYELKNGCDITVPHRCSSTPTLDSDSGSTPSSSGFGGYEDAKTMNGKSSHNLNPIAIDDNSTGEDFDEVEDNTAVRDIGGVSKDETRSPVRDWPRRPPTVRVIRQSNPVSAQKDKYTAVTKWIRKLVGGLYVKELLVCCTNDPQKKEGDLVEFYVEKGKLDALIDVTCNREDLWKQGWVGQDYTEEVELVRPVKWQDRRLRKKGYGAAFINKDRFLSGDCIIVRAGVDEVDHLTANGRMKSNIKEAAAKIWFARIIYIFANADKEAMVHVRWFSHGGDTFLNETAGPKELFLLDRCDDIDMTSIAGKIEVERCTETGPSEESDRFKKVNFYFYRFFYDDSKMTPVKFEDATFHEKNLEHADLERSPDCYCCAKREQRLLDRTMRVTGPIDQYHSTTGFSYNGVEYKMHDCVYMLPTQSDRPHKIGQIIGIKCTGYFNWAVKDPAKLPASVREIFITTQILKRYDDFNSDYFSDFKRGAPHDVRDSRRLYLTNKKKKVVVDDRLLGKCHVVHTGRIDNLTQYKDLEDTFHVADRLRDNAKPSATNGTISLNDLEPLNAKDFNDSADGNEMVAIEKRRQEIFSKAGLKLRAMDVFAGCGGLTSGLRESGAVETMYGIEWDVDASKTLKRNFPHMKVYNENANTLLQRAIQEEQGSALDVMKDLQGNPMPRMPRRGEIDCLYGGPPCQDFSGCNRCPKANSSKNSLLTTFLSYVDHYRPKYFLLENVRGLLQHRLGSTQHTKTTVKGGIEQGSVKFILRALTSLGYSAQFHTLQAAEHGSPQSRRRVFFWGSLLGLRLPLYPQPTHVCKGLSAATNTFTIGKSAPHNPVTIGDSITDLPAFDWRITVPGESRRDIFQRELRIPRVSIPKNKSRPVGENSQLYASRPITEFQWEIRRHVTEDFVKNHFTRRWGDVKMMRIARIPMKPGANHNDLDSEHDMKCLRKNEVAAGKNFYPNRFQRLDYNEQFQTCLTNVDPSGENGKILHPTQRRILTVREFARAQGFLDTFTWDSNTQSPQSMYKQIGNAVSLQLGRALGKELFNALYDQWESRKEASIQEKSPTAYLNDSSEVEAEFEGFDENVVMEDVSANDGHTFNELIVISDSE